VTPESPRYDKHGNKSFQSLDVVRDIRNGWVGTVLEINNNWPGCDRFAYVEFAREDGRTLACRWMKFTELEIVQPTRSGEAS
jgi:hypothetical protein